MLTDVWYAQEQKDSYYYIRTVQDARGLKEAGFDRQASVRRALIRIRIWRILYLQAMQPAIPEHSQIDSWMVSFKNVKNLANLLCSDNYRVFRAKAVSSSPHVYRA